MKTKSPIKEYLSRLWKQTWIMATGGGGFLVTFIIEIYFPNVLPVGTYVAIFIASFVVASYLAFSDLYKNYLRLEETIEKNNSSRPKLMIGIQDAKKNLNSEITREIKPIPDIPDYKKIISDEREKLLEEHLSYSNEITSVAALNVFVFENSRYEEELDEYLKELQLYLERLYQIEITKDRAILFHPIIENVGNSPINTVSIEIQLPSSYRELPSDTLSRILLIIDDDSDFIPDRPMPPEHTLSNLSASIFEAIKVPMSIPDFDLPLINSQSNVYGPNFEKRNDSFFITYDVEKLVQHKTENDFPPFLLWVPHITATETWKLPVKIYAEELKEPHNSEIKIKFICE